MPIIFTGDFFPRQPFQESPFPDTANVIANLESAISSRPAAGSKAYPMVLGRQTLDAVAESRFAALNLANNHVFDAGEAAFAEMVKALAERSATQFYGTRARPFATLTDGKTRCAIIGCLERCRSRRPPLFREEDVARLIRDLLPDYDRIFVTPHWGKEGEYASHPSPRQRALAQRWIHSGAHGVLGHHPHTFHGREQIAGRPVYYSLGNLFFNEGAGRRYALNRFGLAVTWRAGRRAEEDTYQEDYTFQTDEAVQSLDAEGRELLSPYLEAISADFTDKPWGLVRWARAVGPIYIPKSQAAWMRRVSHHKSIKVRLMYLIWSLLPTTLYLRWGNRFPDPQIFSRRNALEQILTARYPLNELGQTKTQDSGNPS